MLAAIRPPGQDFPVLLHIVGATIVFGALLASATSLALARGEIRLLRLGYFSLLRARVQASVAPRPLQRPLHALDRIVEGLKQHEREGAHPSSSVCELEGVALPAFRDTSGTRSARVLARRGRVSARVHDGGTHSPFPSMSANREVTVPVCSSRIAMQACVDRVEMPRAPSRTRLVRRSSPAPSPELGSR